MPKMIVFSLYSGEGKLIKHNQQNLVQLDSGCIGGYTPSHYKLSWTTACSLKGGQLTAGWSIPRVFSLIASASFNRLAASLYLFWSL